MARLVISDQPKPQLDVNEPTTRPRINPKEIERGLGAEQVGLLAPAGSPISAYALRQELFRRLRSTGGRPGLDGTDMKPKIPMQRSQWDQLRHLTLRATMFIQHPRNWHQCFSTPVSTCSTRPSLLTQAGIGYPTPMMAECSLIL